MFLKLRKTTLVLILATAVTALCCLSAQASDPLAGTWELNLEKSKFNPGPPPKSKTRVYEVTGQQEKMIATTIDVTGNQTVQQYSATRDGKDYPFEGWQIADTVSVVPVDLFTVNYTMKKAGVEVVTGTRMVSKDGRVLTFPVKFTNAKGQVVDNVEVFDKR
jgi:hypothetical protein